jgi:hypothetical protein
MTPDHCALYIVLGHQASSSSVQPVLNSKHCLTTTAMLLLKHKPFQCYLTIKSRMKISCELKERRFSSRVISGGHYPQAGISVRARLKKTFGCSQTKWSQSCQVWACVWKEDSPIQPSWKGMNKNGERHARILSSNPIEILQQVT